MITDPTPTPTYPALPPPHILQLGESLEIHATSDDVVIAVTSHRLVMSHGARSILDLQFAGLRRIQFDIERGKAATLVIVPETREPRVVAIQIPELRETALALALIGRRLNEQEPE